MKKYAAVAVTLLISVVPIACEGEKDKGPNESAPTAPSVPAEPVSPTDTAVNGDTDKPFRDRLVGVWLGCHEGPESSRSWRFNFTADSLTVVTTDFRNTKCQEGGAPAEFPPETWKVRFVLGEKQGSKESYDFDYTLVDQSGIPSGTVYTSIKIEGENLVMSRGKENLDENYGNGKTPETRFVFPEDASKARNRVLKRIP